MNPPQPPSPAPVSPRPIVIARDWLIVSILALVVALLWIGLSVYQTLHTSNIPAPEQRRLTLFSVELDDGVIPELGQKKQVLGQTIDESARVIFTLPGEQKAVEAVPAVPTGAPTGTP